MGEKRAFSGASMGGWINAADDRLSRESMDILAVGGGVDKSSCKDGENSGTYPSLLLAKSVAKYSPPCEASNSAIRAGGAGDFGKPSYGANRGDGVNGTRR